MENAIAVYGVDLAEARSAAGFMRRDQRRAGAGERVEHNSAATRDVFDRVGDHRHRLDGWVQGKFIEATGFEGIDAAILPYVGTVAPMLTKLEAVDMWSRPTLECEYLLVARSVEGAHAEMLQAGAANYSELKNLIVWIKDNGAMNTFANT